MFNKFCCCIGLTKVQMQAITPPTANSSLFFGCSALTTIYVPTGGMEAYNQTPWNAYTVTDEVNTTVSVDGIYYILDLFNETAEVTSAGSGTYSGSISIPESVTYEGMEYSVTSIKGGSWYGGGAFHSCTGLTSITIPNSVTYIGDSAFARCTGLTSITIPNSVTTIDKSAFYSCSGLTSVTISSSVTSIRDYTFGSCFSLTSVTIPNSVTSIGDFAFCACSGLMSLTMNPATPPSPWAPNLFSGCKNLSTIYVPNEDILLAYEAEAPWNYYNICIVESDADDTGIEAVEMEGETMSNAPVYDLNGRRVGRKDQMHHLPQGVYVVGGKKIIR